MSKAYGINHEGEYEVELVKEERLVIAHKHAKHLRVDALLRSSNSEGVYRCEPGHDTTSSAMGFALYCLAENPKVQAAAIEELREIFADDNFRTVVLKDLQDMKYLELIIKETLRLYPSAPMFGRNAHEDIEYGQLTIPKGTSLIVNVCGVHRNPELFPEPEKFIPERFVAEDANQRHTFGYIAFSAGPRHCVGQMYAMLEMKTVLSTILKHYEILPTSPKHYPKLSSEIILVSSNGIRVCLVKRNF